MTAYDTEEDAPLDPAAKRLRRKLVRLLFVSGGIMMAGLIAVIAAIVYKLGKAEDGGARAISAARTRTALTADLGQRNRRLNEPRQELRL